MEVNLGTTWQSLSPSETLSLTSSIWEDPSSTSPIWNNYEQPSGYMAKTDSSPSDFIGMSTPTSIVSLDLGTSLTSNDPQGLTATTDSEGASDHSHSSSSSWWGGSSNGIHTSTTTLSSLGMNMHGTSDSTQNGDVDSFWGVNPTMVPSSSSSSPTAEIGASTFTNAESNFISNWWSSSPSSSYDFTSGVSSTWTSTSSSPNLWTTSNNFNTLTPSTSLPLSISSLGTPNNIGKSRNMKSNPSALYDYSSEAEVQSPFAYATSKTASQSSYGSASESPAAATSLTTPTFAWLSGWYSSWFLSSTPTVLPSKSEAPAITATTDASSNLPSSPETSTTVDVSTILTPTPSSTSQSLLISPGTPTSTAFTIVSLGSPSTSTIPTSTIPSSSIMSSTTAPSASSTLSLINTIDNSPSPSDLWIYSWSEPQTLVSSLPATEDLISTDTTVWTIWSNTFQSMSSVPSPITAPSGYMTPSSSIIPTTTSDLSITTLSVTQDYSDTVPTSADEPSTAGVSSNYLPFTSSVMQTVPSISNPIMTPTTLSSDPVDTTPSGLLSTTSTPVSTSSVWLEATPTDSDIENSQVVTSSTASPDPSVTSNTWINFTPQKSSHSSFFIPSTLSLLPESATSSLSSSAAASLSPLSISASSSISSTTSSEKSMSSRRKGSNSFSEPPFKNSTSARQSSSTSSINTGYSVSYGTRTAYYIYTQTYVITASTTTFGTGLPTTVEMPRSGSKTFSAPQSAITQGMEFYNSWLDNNFNNGKNHHHSHGGGSDTGAIVGSVVGGVCGLLGCCLAAWIFLHRRRNKKRNAVASRGFGEEIGNRLEDASPPETARTGFQEKPEEPLYNSTGNNESQFFSIFRTTEIPQTANENPASNPNSLRPRETDGFENPFHDEFILRGRPHTQAQVKPPPIPPPRKMHSNTQHPVPFRNIDSSHEDYSSLASSLNDSSFVSSLQGDYSTLSSGPIRLEHGSYGGNIPENPAGGFFREII